MDAAAHVPMSDIHKQTLEEHDEIKAFLDRVRGYDPIRMPAALKELHTALTQHCAHEEAPEGLFDVIGERAPELRRKIQQLRAEHTSMLAELLQLSYLRGTDERLKDDVAQFRQRLLDHEAMERELFKQALGGEPD